MNRRRVANVFQGPNKSPSIRDWASSVEYLHITIPNVSLVCSDVTSPSSCMQGASALFDMIEYYESATHLNISFNKHIGTRGWQAAAHMMRKVSVSPKQDPNFYGSLCVCGMKNTWPFRVQSHCIRCTVWRREIRQSMCVYVYIVFVTL